MKDFLNFKTLIAPVAIKAAFWIAVVICVLIGLFSLTQNIWAGLGIIIFGPIVARLYAELMIIAFEIFGVLKEIRDKK